MASETQQPNMCGLTTEGLLGMLEAILSVVFGLSESFDGVAMWIGYNPNLIGL